MKAIVINDYGTVDVLIQTEVAMPQPGPMELLVEVKAFALNPVDYKIRAGHLKNLFPVTFPRILGGDVAGIVRGRGPGAADFEVGDEVYFSAPLDRNGANAEFLVVDQGFVAKKSKKLNFEDAASLPVVGLTSVQALRNFGGIKPGDKVLIHAGSGGIGSFAIQFAKTRGATVFTTTSAQNFDYVRSLGADQVIDYRNEDFVTVSQSVGGMDIVLDSLGGEDTLRSVMAAKKGGAVSSLVEPPSPEATALAQEKKVKTGFFLLDGNRADLNLISGMIEDGQIRPTVSKIFDFQDIVQGHRELESGRTRGKIVVRVN